MLTKRFFSKGLYPCIRQASRAVEIVSEITFLDLEDQANTINRFLLNFMCMHIMHILIL